MTVAANGGLISIASEAGSAANDDRLAEKRFVEKDKRADVAAGWDPYDIWRTRVKNPREARMRSGEDKRSA